MQFNHLLVVGLLLFSQLSFASAGIVNQDNCTSTSDTFVCNRNDGEIFLISKSFFKKNSLTDQKISRPYHLRRNRYCFMENLQSRFFLFRRMRPSRGRKTKKKIIQKIKRCSSHKSWWLCRNELYEGTKTRSQTN